jgi:hypothetical protein
MRKKLAVSLAGLILVWISGPRAEPAKKPGHLLIQVVLLDNEFRVVKITPVKSGIQKRRDKNRVHPWRLVVKSGKGLELYRAGLPDPTELRGEFVNPRDPLKIDGHHIKRTGPISFAVRVPRVPGMAGARIEFYSLKPELRRTPNPPDESYALLGSVEYPRREKQK